MKLIHRLGYYFGGFSIGLIFLAFFLSGKRTSCDYGPNARVLKEISSKQLQYASNAQEKINSKVIDSTTISLILKQGNVNFSKSKPRIEPCNLYIIEKTVEDEMITLTVENCKEIATIKNIIVN